SRVMAVRNHVTLLERSVLATLAELGLAGETHAHAPGVWVGQAKIAALGVRIRQGVAYHGVAINRCPDMDYFQGIIPCGIQDSQVTSLAELGVSISRTALEELYVQHFSRLFGPVEP
ncbi:MAG: lipoyl(octanoyl) transferase LipB, partial [Magnetococcales bacterium]|nr:lipoyl(octanoyl) transferase LipB [Magnetococcales bacterium]